MSFFNASLDDICSLITDGTHYTPPDIGEGIPFLTVRDMTPEGLDFEGCAKISFEEFEKLDAGNCSPKIGDILFSKDGTVGKVHLVKEQAKFGVLSSIAILRPQSSKVDGLYLSWALRSPDLISQAGESKTGSALRRLVLKDLKKLSVKLPPLATQQHIARVLEQADQLRKQAQQMERELNQLAQSLFLEMFGDPSSMAFSNRVPLISLAANEDDIKCGPFGTQLGKSEFTTSGVPLWGIKHVNSNFSLQTHEFVSEAKAKELNAYLLIPDDIVMTRKGTVGNCHLYPKKFVTGVMHSDLLRIRVDKDKVIPLFLVTLLRLSKDVERQIDLISHGAIMAGINVTKLKKIEIDLPPLSMQKRFCVRLEAIQEELLRTKQSAEEHETLFMALMQRAFNGELTAPEHKAA